MARPDLLMMRLNNTHMQPSHHHASGRGHRICSGRHQAHAARQEPVVAHQQCSTARRWRHQRAGEWFEPFRAHACSMQQQLHGSFSDLHACNSMQLHATAPCRRAAMHGACVYHHQVVLHFARPAAAADDDNGSPNVVLSIRRAVRSDGTTQTHVKPHRHSAPAPEAPAPAPGAPAARWEAVTQSQLQERLQPLGIQLDVVDRYVVTQSRQAVGCQDPVQLAGQLETMLGAWVGGWCSTRVGLDGAVVWVEVGVGQHVAR